MNASWETVTVIDIKGMQRPLSSSLVAQALAHVPGVRNVVVSLDDANATVEHHATCTPGDLVEAVRSAGFEASAVSVAFVERDLSPTVVAVVLDSGE